MKVIVEWMPLSARQWEIVELVGAGLSNEAIAAKLFVCPATVKTHLNDIYTKLGAKNRANLIAIVSARQARRAAELMNLLQEARAKLAAEHPEPRTAAWFRQDGALTVLDQLIEQATEQPVSAS